MIWLIQNTARGRRKRWLSFEFRYCKPSFSFIKSYWVLCLYNYFIFYYSNRFYYFYLNFCYGNEFNIPVSRSCTPLTPCISISIFAKFSFSLFEASWIIFRISCCRIDCWLPIWKSSYESFKTWIGWFEVSIIYRLCIYMFAGIFQFSCIEAAESSGTNSLQTSQRRDSRGV